MRTRRGNLVIEKSVAHDAKVLILFVQDEQKKESNAIVVKKKTARQKHSNLAIATKLVK